MARVIPIPATPLDMEFRSALVNLINSAKQEVILFENPKDGLNYLVIDRKHWVRWVELENLSDYRTIFYVDSRPRLLKGLRYQLLKPYMAMILKREKRNLC